MTTLTLEQLSPVEIRGDFQKTRQARKRMSAPPSLSPPAFCFPAAPAPQHEAGNSASTDGYSQESPTYPTLATPDTPLTPVSPDAYRNSSHYSFAPSETLAEALPTHTSPVSQAVHDNLPSFSFGAGSDAQSQATPTDQSSNRRRHKHKRSTAQSIDITGLDLKPPPSADGLKKDDVLESLRTSTGTPSKLTFGPSPQMEQAESEPTSSPPGSRGSVRAKSSDSHNVAFVRDEPQGDSVLIDLDLADAPSPKLKPKGRTTSMHSGGRSGFMQFEHRRTESAPQLAPPFIFDPHTRRQSTTPSSFFQPMEEVFEEDEDESSQPPEMSHSAMPSPQTTLNTPRFDTGTSSAASLSVENSCSDMSDLRPRSSRRSRFLQVPKKLRLSTLWKWAHTSKSERRLTKQLQKQESQDQQHQQRQHV